jgi:serine/threonine protein kinase
MTEIPSQIIKAPPVGTTLGERYKLLRFLGSGAIGAVYEAATPSDERVAVKVLLEIDQSELGKELSLRFVREARVASTLDSEHIVPVIDSGLDAALGIPYLVMPLLSGVDVESLLERVGSLHPTVAVRMIAQACEGLLVAHRGSVVHRDIKPSNLFLHYDPSGKVTVRVLDFGLAKVTGSDESITRAGSIMGTPHYMSPEQSKNAKDVDGRSDVWGIAATLYHLLTGLAPFHEERRFVDLHMAINTKDIPPIQERAPWIDPGLATIVHGALLRDRAVRCPSIKELGAALFPYTLNTNDINAMMLEPVPAVLRTMKASTAKHVDVWEPCAPSSEVPALSTEPIDPLLGKKLGNRYTLLRRLGRSGKGGLYEALGPEGNRFAVRAIDPKTSGADPVASQRFVREARALVSIDSPHVNKLVDASFDEELNQPFVVLELLHGLDLQLVIDKFGPIDPRVAVPLIIQACAGLRAAHAHGIVHRDVQPKNLFLVEQPSGQIVVKLTGFGAVKRITKEDGDAPSHELTRGGDVLGSMLHMPPEQARNPKNADQRSDLWGLGATLYHLLSGKPPWPTDKIGADMLITIGSSQPPHVQDSAPWVRRGLAAALHRALKVDPAERYNLIEDFGDALRPFTVLTNVKLQELEPLPSDLRARIEERAEPPEPDPNASGPALPRFSLVEPLPSVAAHELQDERRKAARRATMVVVAVGVLTIAAVAIYLGVAVL